MFLWQFNDGMGWRGGGGGFPTIADAAQAAKDGHWPRFGNDHLRVVAKAPADRSTTTGYLTHWWQDGQDAEERLSEHGI